MSRIVRLSACLDIQNTHIFVACFQNIRHGQYCGITVWKYTAAFLSSDLFLQKNTKTFCTFYFWNSDYDIFRTQLTPLYILCYESTFAIAYITFASSSIYGLSKPAVHYA